MTDVFSPISYQISIEVLTLSSSLVFERLSPALALSLVLEGHYSHFPSCTVITPTCTCTRTCTRKSLELPISS